MSDAAGEAGATRELLDERYGRGRKRSFDRRFGWAAAAALVFGGLGFLLFSGWHLGSDLEYKDLDYSVVDARTVRVDALVTSPAGSSTVCAFEAVSESYATVGWKIVELPPSDERMRRISETIVTTSLATTGTVRECWLLDAPAT